MTDPIADLLTRIKNALRVRKKQVIAPYSKIKVGILKILRDKGLIRGFKIEGDVKKNFIIYLKYDENGEPLIEDLKRVSKPGRRVYAGYKELRPLRRGFAFRIVSTSRGLITDEEARKRKLGGEIICEVY
ncbi:MAG: 30S ribosomal protein S8 [Candidatus Parcubacteria bacterium]|nr:MAG: 30S ribosomal protein S8 [Candidatus Parcubacteria bacterium]